MWNEAQIWEAEWWGDCLNTYGEQEKQLTYARKMGLEFYSNGKSAYNIDLAGAAVIDIGGGPTSLLLKCHNRGQCKIIDPLPVPKWVIARYEFAGIKYDRRPAEEMSDTGYAEAWIYNVLEHTRDPRVVIRRAQQAAKIIRLFEWIDTVPSAGHLHSFTESQLNEWLNGEGRVELFNRGSTRGRGYYGVFPC